MTHRINHKYVFLVIAIMIFPFLSSIRTLAQEPPEKVLIPMGGGYTDLYPGLMSAILSRSRSEVIQIAVLPAAYASNPETISQSEREDNLLAAEGRRAQIEDACRKAAGRKLPCEVNLAPVFTRADAQDPANVAFITPNLDAVFLLGGDQTIAMQVLADTPMESALQSAYEAGVIIAGTSAGAGVMATNMLGGYAEDFSTESSLQFGSVDLWNKELRRGLSFGLKSAIIDQHFFQLGRPGRLLSAIIQPDSPHVGIGLDAFTGVEISDDEVVGNAFGRYTYAIFDAKTFHSAQTVHYYPPENTLSVRNVLVHLLAPGDSTYNLVTRQHSLEAAPERVERDFEMLSLPQGAGNLILYGGHLLRAAKDPTLPGFLNMSGGSQANILLILAGYASRAEAQEAEAAWRQSLTIDPGIKVDSIQLTSRMTETIELSGNYTGIILTGEDQSQIPVETLRNVRVAWMAGMPILAENAAAAVVGSYYSASRPNGPASEDYANNAQKVFLQNVAPLQPGLGLIPAMIEPQLLVDNRWGNLFALAYNHPETVALGITEGAIIELSGGEAFVRGNNPVVALDFRQAKLSLGTNDGFVVANGLLDVFTPGDHLRPEVADVNITPIQAPTPEFTATATASPTPTATPAPTATITSTPTPEPPTPTPKGWRPTRTPRPTSTPLTIPPPTDKNSLNAMIFFCVLAVIVVVVGVIINRTRQA